MRDFTYMGNPRKLKRIWPLLFLTFLLAYHFITQWLPCLASNALVEVPVKPRGIIVSGLIFYGRRDRASCMFCYLERNLIENGGWLDEILWVVNTDDKDDLKYLDEIISRNPVRHKKLQIIGDRMSTNTYYKAWQHLERGKYYVKIDDDVVWFDDNAIPLLVSRKISHPNDFVVSANIINNPPLGFLHFHMGALHPYLPEVLPSDVVPESWKPSDHGFWLGDSDFTWTPGLSPPHEGHRWLRVQDDRMIMRTPVSKLKYEVWGDSYRSWAIAAQVHYSLLENIEKDTLDGYRFNPPWLMYGQRIRINFMCVFADDILDTDIESWPRDRGDEDMIVLDLPEKLHRPVVVLGDALAAHYQYVDQPELASTDLLKRYQLLAETGGCIASGWSMARS